MSLQKKRRINEKRRLRYREKKNLLKEEQDNKEVDNEMGNGFVSNQAQRKAVYRIKQHMPESPTKFAKVLSRLTSTATPRKRKALENEGILCMTPLKKRRIELFESISKEMRETKLHRSKIQLRRRAIAKMLPFHAKAGLHHYRKPLAFSWGFMIKASQMEGVWDDEKKNKRSIDDKTIELIEDHFKSSGVSVCLPDKKHVSVKSHEPKRILENTLEKTYNEFREQNPECTINFSKFAVLRPKSVRTMKSHQFNGCLCEYCANLEMKILTLKKVLPARGAFSISNRYDLFRLSLCPKTNGEKFYNWKCIERQCKDCGLENIRKEVEPALSKTKTELHWNKWESQVYNDKKGRKSTRKMLRLKNGSANVFLEEMLQEIGPFSSHQHNATWQHNQFNNIIKDVPDNWVIFCMDFAENYTCVCQDEAQSAHWSHDQATLFSIVAYYKCPTCKEISDYYKHDSHSVHHFVTVANTHLQDTRNLRIERETHFSDGASSQFISKTPFADVAASIKDFGFPIEKHFFGSRHGKGPCDGEFGVGKRMASLAVLSRQTVIRNPEELFQYTSSTLTKPKEESENGCVHARRTFFFVRENEISMGESKSNRIYSKQIHETRKQHAVKPDVETAVLKRLLSCFCKVCVSQGQVKGDCCNKEHVDDWKPDRKVNVDKGSKPDKAAREAKKDSKANQDTKKQEKTLNNRRPSRKTQRSQFFKQASGKLQSAVTYEELTTISEEIQQDERYKKFNIQIDDQVSIISHNLVANKIGLKILAKQRVPREYSDRLPVCVKGDGNCLVRAASLACFGYEEKHEEIRVRIVVESCMHKEKYISNKYLNKGMAFPNSEASSLLKTYTMFSEKYTPGDVLTQSTIERVYEEEILSVSKRNKYMGIWQLFALASVVGVKIISLYPEMGSMVPRVLLNRTIIPREIESNHSKLLILWSSLREDMRKENWIPNNFVPLLPQSVQPDFDIDPDFEDLDISMNESFIDSLFETLSSDVSKQIPEEFPPLETNCGCTDTGVDSKLKDTTENKEGDAADTVHEKPDPQPC